MNMDITQESVAGLSSSQKGKGIEADTKNWRAGWWDIYPLLERPKRPIVWSQSSVIFSADATQPIITGRHFSSSKQFVLPSPTPIMSSAASYEPPTIIVPSPGDTHLLAYFPRRDGEGTACLWERGPQIDNWGVKECWSCPKGSGIVSASWLAVPREWIITSAGPLRLPARGPGIPLGDLSLLMVTQDNYVHVTYFYRYAHGLRTVKRSLQFQGVSKEQAIGPDYGENPNHSRQCVDAAIGLGYNESTVYIATHSRRAPTSTPPVPGKAFQNLGLSVGEDPLNSMSPDQRNCEWENWGDERTIELFELLVRFDGTHLVLAASFIVTLEFQPQNLTGLALVSTVPTRTAVPPADAASSSQHQTKAGVLEKGKMALVATFVDFHDYTKPPTSSLIFYGIHIRMQNNASRPVPTIAPPITRTIEQGVITHMEPFTDLSGPMIYVCILDVSGVYNVAKSSPRQASIGTIQVLHLPNFNDNVGWVPSEIKLPVDKLGSDLPLYGTVSPNRKLFCALTSSVSNGSTTIHPLPSHAATETLKPRLAMSFCSAILSKISTTDIIYALCSSDFSVADIGDILHHMLSALEKYNISQENPNKSQSMYVPNIMGIAAEIYRRKAESSKDSSDAENLKRMWKTALDVCSLCAVIRAFEDCRDNNDNSKYDLDVVWQLIALSTWVIEFTEKIMKACVMASNATLDSQEQSDIDLLTQPVLLHISNPFCLVNLIAALTHVRALRSFLGSLPAGSENAKMAQTLLLDTVDCSGIDFASLSPLLQTHLEAVQKMEEQDCRRALATCHPTKLMQPLIYQLVQQLSKSETLLNKSALFIKPHDLIEGLARLSTSPHQKSSEKDIITKNSLPKEPIARDVCLRCGGKAAVDRTLYPRRGEHHSKWHLFELAWQLHCICGGQWSSSLSI